MKVKRLRVSIEMFRAVLAGETCDMIAHRHGIVRSAVERRIQRVERAMKGCGLLRGVMAGAPAPLKFLRANRVLYEAALESLEQQEEVRTSAHGVTALEDDQIERAAQFARETPCAMRNVALVYTLFGTGLTPIELARLEVRDYLKKRGTVRGRSTVRAEVAFNGRERPLLWVQERVVEAVDHYPGGAARGRTGMQRRAPLPRL
jgi:integrase